MGRYIRSATKVMREQLSATYAVEPPGRWIRNKLKAPLLQGRHREPAGGPGSGDFSLCGMSI